MVTKPLTNERILKLLTSVAPTLLESSNTSDSLEESLRVLVVDTSMSIAAIT